MVPFRPLGRLRAALAGDASSAVLAGLAPAPVRPVDVRAVPGESTCQARRSVLAGAAAMLLAPAVEAASVCAAAASPAAPADTTPEAPPLLQAQTAPDDLDPQGWLVSEKLDGVRGFWDGCVMRSRSGRRIAAPAWFLERLPSVALDGELWMGRGRFEALSAAVRRHRPDDAEWRAIRYMVFEAPGAEGAFAARVERLQHLARAQTTAGFQVVPQRAVDDDAALRVLLDQVVAVGGEGLMLHRADAPYITGRSPVLLKLKPEEDAEAVVIGYQPGRGRHAGRLGALRLRDGQGRVFEIGSGFTDAQRSDPVPLGATVTYTYRGRTAGGLPRFATFKRVRDEP